MGRQRTSWQTIGASLILLLAGFAANGANLPSDRAALMLPPAGLAFDGRAPSLVTPTPSDVPAIGAKAVSIALLPHWMRLGDFLAKYKIALTDTLPNSGQTVGDFFNRFSIDPEATLLYANASEPLGHRLIRSGYLPLLPISIETPAGFRAMTLATMESYARLHPAGDPGPSKDFHSREDQFDNALIREIFGHDVYVNSKTLGSSQPLADGSVLFETAYAPIETGNDDLIRNKSTLLAQLEMIRMDSEDGVMNGKELKLKAAQLFDSDAGTHFADGLANIASNPAAIIDREALAGPSHLPIALSDLQDIADRNHMPVETIIRANVVFHALAAGGVQEGVNDPSILTVWDEIDAANATGTVAPPPFSFGSIDFIFNPDVKAKMSTDLQELDSTGNDPFLFGDDLAPGVIGRRGFLNQILFLNFGLSPQD